MQEGKLIKEIKLKEGTFKIYLDEIYPIGKVDGKVKKIVYYIDEEINLDSNYANKLEVTVLEESVIKIFLGLGYVAQIDKEFDKIFSSKQYHWSGGDGIFSFNLTNGKDHLDLKEEVNTLFVFGDTFVGYSDPLTHNRIQPHAMPNNTIAYMKEKEINFYVNQSENGAITSYYKMDPKFDTSGSVPYQLIDELDPKKYGYLSAYNRNKATLVFDFHKKRKIDNVVIYNYYNQELSDASKRGFKEISFYISDDNKKWEIINNTTLKKSQGSNDFENVYLNTSARYIKLIAKSNYNDSTFKEGIFGLNKIKFFSGKREYKDIFITADSVYLEKQDHAWIWLQDGVVIKDKLYFIPIIINSDTTQPEGLQFRVCGAALFETKIKNEQLDFSTVKQKRAPLMARKNGNEYLLGAAIFSNTTQAGALNPDGYIYVYGFVMKMGLRELIVGRVKENDFAYFDDWQFYANGKWVSNLTDAEPLLKHVSAEMSVIELRQGHNKGKFMAVYTFDTNTKKVAFSIGESLTGPFSKPQIIYITPEQEIFKSTTYTYNAKAHPHLSKSDSILVSYNTNTYSYKHNMSDNRVYNPRFIRLKDTSKDAI